MVSNGTESIILSAHAESIILSAPLAESFILLRVSYSQRAVLKI
jgi:hypothetical protein